MSASIGEKEREIGREEDRVTMRENEKESEREREREGRKKDRERERGEREGQRGRETETERLGEREKGERWCMMTSHIYRASDQKGF